MEILLEWGGGGEVVRKTIPMYSPGFGKPATSNSLSNSLPHSLSSLISLITSAHLYIVAIYDDDDHVMYG